MALLVSAGIAFACGTSSWRAEPGDGLAPRGPEGRSEPLALLFSTSGGTLAGKVVFDGPPPPPNLRRITVDADACGVGLVIDRSLVVDSRSKAVRHAVVTLESPERAVPPQPTRTYSLKIVQCDVDSYVTVVPIGSRVDVTNTDRTLHALDREALPPGARISKAMTAPGIHRLDCDLHPWSGGWVVSTTAPFAAVTGSDGEFAFRGVPEGYWVLTVWQVRLGTLSREVWIGRDRQVREVVSFTPPAVLPPWPALEAAVTGTGGAVVGTAGRAVRGG